MAEMLAGAEPAVFRPPAPLFDLETVFGWISVAHPPHREHTARDKLAMLHRSWGQDAASPPLLADPGRPAEMIRDGGVLLDASGHLPRARETFDAWVARVRAKLGGRFGMQAPGLECASWQGHHTLAGLMQDVLRTTGPRTFRYNAFVGDYARTPFGFHVDPHQEAVFQYTLHGRREALFWNALALGEADTAWLENPDPASQPGRDPDFVFTLEPGDLVFWPGTYAHGMQCEGPSAGLSMVVDRASPRTREQVISSLETQTAGGRCAMPAVDEGVMVEPGTTLVRTAVFPLAYERFDDVLMLGVCGRTLDWPDPHSIAAAIRLVDALNGAREHAVDELMAEFSDHTLPPEMVCEVLSIFAGLGFCSLS